MEHAITGTESVPIDTLTPYPGNPRRGDIDAIEDSLRTLGQFKPITVNRRDRTILAGHHTVEAARRLGWTTIEVAWVDLDAADARRIVLGDNRIGDLATYDDTALLNLLRALPDLEGTGFSADELDQLDGLYDEDSRGGGEGASDEAAAIDDPDAPAKVRLGPVFLYVRPAEYEDWFQSVLDDLGDERKKLAKEIRRRLGIPAARRRSKKQDSLEGSTPPSTLPVEQVPVTSLNLLPGNARQGDIGAISRSLLKVGQYRPLVVRRADSTILIGNHTYQAALALGLSEVSVVWLDVDQETAYKIAIADNRTSDLGDYDHDELAALLLQTGGDLDGTGWEPDDVEELLNGGPAKPGPRRRVSCTVGEIRFSVDRYVFDGWLAELPQPPQPAIIDRLGLNPAACHYEEA